MNWALVENRPRSIATMLQAAEQRRALAFRADYCVKWLKVQGFDVLRVEKGAVGPRIIIRTSPLCKQLDGTVSAYSRVCCANTGAARRTVADKSDKTEQRYSFAFRFDCEVRWMEGEQL